MKKSPALVNEKTTAIISYLTIIGTLLAIVLNNTERSPFVSFHIRQNLGINSIFFANQWIIYTFFGWFIAGSIWILILTLWGIGLLGVLKNETKLVPVIGAYFQKWFKAL